MIPEANSRKVLVIGWDAADWRVITPLLEKGEMPNLQKMMDTGAHGNISTLEPAISPMLWTSIATGKRPFKHGIHGFTEPGEDGKSIHPITIANRSCKAVWNILNQCGKKSNVVGWWPSHPAEPINGVMVSNWYQQARNLKDPKINPLSGRAVPAEFGWTNEQWAMPEGCVSPEEYSERLQEFRFHPSELEIEHITPFVPKIAKIENPNDPRIFTLSKVLCDCVSIHGASTALMQLEPWDFMAIYFDGIDHFSHAFMKYHGERRARISEADHDIFKDVVEGGYKFHDLMLGATLKLAGPETTVLLLSDHGFHPDHLRPQNIPTEPSGPTIEHRPYGVFVASGPGIVPGTKVHGASVLDLCPTILSIYDLPVGLDMDGKSLVNILENSQIKTIDSWESIDGDSGMHPNEMRMNSQQNAEAIQQLIELGYIEPIDDDNAKALNDTTRELKYNLAISYMDTGRFSDALSILIEIWDQNPDLHRFGYALLICRAELGQIEERASDITKLKELQKQYADDAIQDIQNERDYFLERGIKIPKLLKNANGVWEYQPQPTAEEEAKTEIIKASAKDIYRIKKLTQLAGPFKKTNIWIDHTQAVASKSQDRIRESIQQMLTIRNPNPEHYVQIGKALIMIDEWDKAEKHFRFALKRDPDHAGAHCQLSECLLHTKNHEESLEHAFTAVELLYSDPRHHVQLGRALKANGEAEGARTAFNVALRQHYEYPEAHAEMCDLIENHFDEPDVAEKHRIKSKQDPQAHTQLDTSLAEAEVQRKANERKSRRTPIIGKSSLWNRVESNEVITIVSGLPRSGTSAMMQMLTAGGMEAYTDAMRAPDKNNPAGYLEHSKSQSLQLDSSWIHNARGKCVKVIAQLLPYLPVEERYRIIFMDRDLREVTQSQKIMLTNLNRPTSGLSNVDLMQTLNSQTVRAEQWMKKSGNIQALFINYLDLVNSSTEVVSKADVFLCRNLNRERMIASVKPELHRQQSPE